MASVVTAEDYYHQMITALGSFENGPAVLKQAGEIY